MRHRPAALLITAAALIVGACGAATADEGWSYPDIQTVADQTAAGASPEPTLEPSPSATPGSSASPTPGATALPLAAAAPANATVQIADFAFGPATVTVAPGGTVTWSNEDGDRHSILLDGTESERLETGGTYSRTFASAGEFSYLCGLHPSMTGTVVVAAAGGDPSAPAAGATPGAAATANPTANPTADPTAGPTADPSPTSSPDDDDDRDDDRDDDHSGHGGGNDDDDDRDDDEDHSGPGGGGSGHG